MNLESALLAIEHGAAAKPIVEAFQATLAAELFEAYLELMDYPSQQEVQKIAARLIEQLGGPNARREAMGLLQRKQDERSACVQAIRDREEEQKRLLAAQKAEPAFDPVADAAAVPQL